MSRRIETACKAGSLGQSAQHDEAHGFRSPGKCCGCVATVHVLIRGDLSGWPLSIPGSCARHGNMPGDRAGVSRGHSRRRTLPSAIRQLATSRGRTPEALSRRRAEHRTGKEPQAMKYRLHNLSPYLRGWMGYFGISEPYRDIPEIDGWIRRRVRMCYWKQWRRCRTKIRELLRLGTLLGAAIRAGLNRSGPWAMARRLAAQSGMTNQWLKEQGLISVKELWVKIHYPATAR